MSEIPKPEIIDAKYINEAQLSRVRERGLDLGGGFIRIPEPTLEVVVGLEEIPEDLAWVNFFKRAVIRLRYPEESGIAGEETFESRRKQIGESYFVVDHLDDTPVFKTKTEILESGQLTAYMHQWLTRIADNPQTGSTEYWDFEELFGREF